MSTADGLFRRFQNREISVAELLKEAKELPSAEFQKLVELMLQHASPDDQKESP